MEFITLPGPSHGVPIGSLESVLEGKLPSVRLVRVYRNKDVPLP